MKSLLLGNLGQWRGTEGNASFGLITQRSKVQILPPQPSFSIGYGLRKTLRSGTPTYSPTSSWVALFPLHDMGISIGENQTRKS